MHTLAPQPMARTLPMAPTQRMDQGSFTWAHITVPDPTSQWFVQWGTPIMGVIIQHEANATEPLACKA